MDATTISEGQYVLYVPPHARGNLRHRDVEKGIVTSRNETYVFVRFGGETQSKACKAEQLA